MIVGAGLSGIGSAHYLKTNCPSKTFAILEWRERLGGTWDLFRYPGIRSDSDMFTLGYSFRPWTDAKAIADGPSILKYIEDTAKDSGIDKKIQFRSRVKRASWSSQEALWTVEVEQGANREVAHFTCNFLFICSGYYNYDAGYTPDFPGAERFKGQIVHPQKWTTDIAFAGKEVVVIGSGATAVTLVPAMAQTAAHVTMLQRSPTYVVSRPSSDARADKLRKRLPAKTAHAIVRWKNVLQGMYIYRMSKRRPEGVKQFIIKGVQDALGPDYDVKKHFTPSYNPWDQRLCLIPDGDLFASIKDGRASISTDQIETFTEAGIKLRSGTEIAADIIVTATGLDLLVLGDVKLTVDGKAVDPGKTMTYKGMMYSDVPNMVVATGYTNASWTLKCDLTCEYVCRMLNYMDKHGYRQCTPRQNDPSVKEQPWVDFSSGYIQRALEKFPKQGSKLPWKLHQNYVRDLLALRFGSVNDGVIEYARSKQKSKTIPSSRSHHADAA